MPGSNDHTMADFDPAQDVAANESTLPPEPSPDSTLAGDAPDSVAGATRAHRGTPDGDHRFDEMSSTFAEGPRKRRHLESATIGEATEMDGTIASELDARDERFDDAADDRTLAGDGAPVADDRTLAGESADARDVERTLAGDGGPDPHDDRTLAGDFAEDPQADDDRTVAGDFDAAGESPADDRTMIGDDPPPHARAGLDDRTIAGSDESAGADATEAGDAPSPAPKKIPASPAAAKPDDGANYELIDDFARGGMGKIWRARDRRIRREVAYKELLPNALKSPVVVERFLKEAQITGQLEHPGVVPIYDLGWQANGTPFYSMKLVRGNTFKKSIEAYHALPRESGERRLAFIKLLQQFVAICNTLGYAHDCGVLHRDLKPLNIMVGDFGETLVLDWGLARLMSASDADEMSEMIASMQDHDDEGTLAADGSPGNDATRDASPGRGATHAGGTQGPATHSGATHGHTHGGTHTGTRRPTVATDYSSAGSQTIMGSVMGTPAYMPPEQALGRLDQLDARSDNYALGAILYEILTNKGPIPKDKLPAMLKHVVEGTIVPPRKIDPSIPKPLEAVCLKALSKEKPQRYASALDLAREVESWLADEPVSAYREPWYDRLRRWGRRHRTLVTTSAFAVVFAVLGLVGWNVAENRRIASLERDARDRIASARTAKDARNYTEASRALTEAAGLVALEPALHGVQTEIQGDLADVAGLVAAEEQRRLAVLRQESQKAASDAEAAVRDRDDPDAAKLILEKAVVRLDGESKLSDERDALQKQLDEVAASIARRQARADAVAKFQQYVDEVDQARFVNSLGVSEEERFRLVREIAVSALGRFGLQAADAKFVPPRDLDEEQVKRVREDALELCLMMAEADFANVVLEGGDRTRAAERSLEWIARARRLGFETKIMAIREVNAYKLLGRTEDMKAAAQRRDLLTLTSALDHFLLAQDYRMTGRLDEAVAEYQASLLDDPQRYWSLQYLGVCHSLLRKPEAAVAAFTAAIASRPDHPASYLSRAVALADLGQVPAALVDLRRAEELDADPYGVSLNRGAVHFYAKDYPAAIAEFERAAQLRPALAAPHRNIADVLSRQGGALIADGDSDGAKPILDRALSEIALALEQTPRDPQLHFLRGDVLALRGDDAAAARSFATAADLEGTTAKQAGAWKQAGLNHHRGERFTEAALAYRNAIAADDSDAEVHRVLAEALIKLGNDAEAGVEYSKFLKAGKPVGDAYRGRGLVFAKQGRYRDAMNDYTRSLELEASPNILTRRGWAYLLQANRLALDDFTEAINLNPENPDSYNGRGYAKVMMGDWRGAVADAEEAVKRTDELAKPAADHWQFPYNASTILAQAVDRSGKDAKLAEDEREKTAAALTVRAIELIQSAAKSAGPQLPVLVQTIQADTALDPIRQRPEFLKAFAPKPAP